MELVVAKTMLELIADGVELPEAIDLAFRIASGLRAAHQQHLMHRDIKPGNDLHPDR